jgi:hypothetical protein
MGKKTPKPAGAFDVVVVGDHPSAAFAAALLVKKSVKHVGLILLAGNVPDDRLVTLNPALFALSPILTPLQAAIPAEPVHGITFLSNEPGVRGEHRVDAPVISVAKYTDVRSAFAGLADVPGIETIRGGELVIHSVDAAGIALAVGRRSIHTSAMIFARPPDTAAGAALGMPDHWDAEVLRRFTILKCKTEKHLRLPRPRTMPMSLDVGSSLAWGRLLIGGGGMMLAVDEPVTDAAPSSGRKLLAGWVEVLKRHALLDESFDYPADSPLSVDLPLAGALVREGVASRSLMIGPAGGFYSQCGEEIYPGCWSAVFAVDTMVKALKDPHLQDGLQPYRQKWPVTLGEYLRGPQQNLRFLLPMVYRNAAMTARMAEAILLSKPVVR